MFLYIYRVSVARHQDSTDSEEHITSRKRSTRHSDEHVHPMTGSRVTEEDEFVKEEYVEENLVPKAPVGNPKKGTKKGPK